MLISDQIPFAHCHHLVNIIVITMVTMMRMMWMRMTITEAAGDEGGVEARRLEGFPGIEDSE